MEIKRDKPRISNLFLRAFTLELIKNSILQLPPSKKLNFQSVQPILVQPMNFDIKPSLEIASQDMQKSVLDLRPIARMKPSSIRQEPKMPTQFPIPNLVPPAGSQMPSGFNIAKLNFLLQDPRVTVIECPGPDKFVLARTLGRTTLTRINLNSTDIQEIIKKFSDESRIPIISGLFKAAVGNLILTAVISDLVGSRFIITKVNPQFFLEQTASKK